ncbi:DUF1707 and DUF4190 domain-containing protein [Actinopolymorpha pittospori]|uniref:DUF4190 domain-containing protein n=1 Tax=Actinopolymorpha pittospori TaxID=648752 RepID=A0A927N0N2_9ACTN|nr:DUF1707 and DUF4190 domain-containing protein [Actinopolymorpha pittospori]MBE1606777.1 hypothetical protein [Actinopolymorpha pittospori]
MSNWHSMRASDADRERAADILKAAYAEGRLTPTEHHARLDALMKSQTYGEIQRHIADLPAGPSPFPTASANPAYPAQQVNPWAQYAPVPIRPSEPLAKASLILGAITPLTCGISGVGAIITGHLALSRINQTGAEGRGMAIAGLVLGYLPVLGTALFMILAVLRG